MSLSITIYNVLFRGEIIDMEDFEEEDEELDFGEMASKVSELATEINTLQPYREPAIELDQLGAEGDFELIFQFRISWMDRDADVEDYLDEVQEVIENHLEAEIIEREGLGITQK